MDTQSDVDPSGILTAQETSAIQEPSKMPPDEERPIVENEAPKGDGPLTKEMFKAQLHLLTERARAAGLNPIQTMVQTYAGQALGVLGGILAALENAEKKKKN